jgi:hypothetical protein
MTESVLLPRELNAPIVAALTVPPSDGVTIR